MPTQESPDSYREQSQFSSFRLPEEWAINTPFADKLYKITCDSHNQNNRVYQAHNFEHSHSTRSFS